MKRHLQVYPIKQTAIRAGIAVATALESAGVPFFYNGSGRLLTNEAEGTKTLFATAQQVLDGDLRGLDFDSVTFHDIANEEELRAAQAAQWGSAL